MMPQANIFLQMALIHEVKVSKWHLTINIQMGLGYNPKCQVAIKNLGQK